MAANYETNAIITARINQLVAALRDPAFCTQLRLDFLSENPYQNGVWYQFSHKVSFSSWGEDVTLSLTAIDDHTTRVAIRSECSMPTQIIDWGKNARWWRKSVSICRQMPIATP